MISSLTARSRTRVFSLVALAGCAAPLPPAALPPPIAPAPADPAPADPAPGDLDAFAEILRLEDARSYDEPRLETYAAASSATLRARTALALGRLGRADALRILTPLLDDPDTAVAATAAFALGELADTSAVPALIRMLEAQTVATRPTVVAEAAYALGKLGSESAHRAVLSLLGRGDPAAAPAAVAGSALLAAWRFPRPADTSPITRWLTAADPELRWRAAYALVRRPEPRAARLLIGLAGDDDPRVRALAARGLTAATLDSARVPHAEALPLLIAATRDADYTVRINATRSLGSHMLPEAVAALRSHLGSPDRHLVATAIESLGRLGAAAGAAAAELETIAADEGAQIFLRQTALESLARVAPTRARGAAPALARHGSWRLRAASARAFAGPGAHLAPELRTLLADSDPRVAAAALQAALDAAGDSVASLRALLVEQLGARDPFVRVTALTAFARMRDPATLPLLLDAYQTAGRDSVNDAALAALDAIAALRTAGQEPARAFFARFRRPADSLVRRKANELFGAQATAAWGEALPTETTHDAQVYGSVVRRWASAGARQPEVVIDTDLGPIRLRLLGEDAPLTTRSFLDLATRGYFDGQEWPRVVTNFVVQGGDPRGDTNGGPGYAIRDEINRHRYLAGSLGMALSGPDTGGSQFFITHSAQPHLDGIYTLFGELVDGMQVLERLLPGDRIRSVRPLPE